MALREEELMRRFRALAVAALVAGCTNATVDKQSVRAISATTQIVDRLRSVR